MIAMMMMMMMMMDPFQNGVIDLDLSAITDSNIRLPANYSRLEGIYPSTEDKYSYCSADAETHQTHHRRHGDTEINRSAAV